MLLVPPGIVQIHSLFYYPFSSMLAVCRVHKQMARHLRDFSADRSACQLSSQVRYALQQDLRMLRDGVFNAVMKAGGRGHAAASAASMHQHEPTERPYSQQACLYKNRAQSQTRYACTYKPPLQQGNHSKRMLVVTH